MITEKDVMALAVLERLTDQFGREHGTFGNDDHTLWNAATEARAHLAARLGELEAKEAETFQRYVDANEARIKAEAELAAVRVAVGKVAEEMEACAQCSLSSEFFGMRFGDTMLTLAARLTDAARPAADPAA